MSKNFKMANTVIKALDGENRVPMLDPNFLNSWQIMCADPVKKVIEISSSELAEFEVSSSITDTRSWLDPLTDKCYPGFEPCSLETSPENTICVPKSASSLEKKEICPLTQISFRQSLFESFIMESTEANSLPL